ncbi:MAG: GNAT family N-acetyltransferase [Candidatus Hodarchaeota archaeon]
MIKLRQANEDDFDFLYQLKKETLKDRISQTWGWDEEWQKSYFTQNFKPENVKIITESGKDIGCLAFKEEKLNFNLSLIEIVPEYQNKGIGTTLIKDLILKARKKNKKLTLQVLKVNIMALKLYRRLGFTVEDENKTHYFMIC